MPGPLLSGMATRAGEVEILGFADAGAIGPDTRYRLCNCLRGQA